MRGAQMAPLDRTPYLQFMPHRTIFGADTFFAMDSCNMLQGRYALSGDRLEFTGIGGTLMLCQRSNEVVAALSDTRTWRRTGNRLFLYDAGGVVTLGLTWSNELGIESNPAPPRPTGDPSRGPVVDESKKAAESPSATST